jgi:hypothetical protein
MHIPHARKGPSLLPTSSGLLFIGFHHASKLSIISRACCLVPCPIRQSLPRQRTSSTALLRLCPFTTLSWASPSTVGLDERRTCNRRKYIRRNKRASDRAYSFARASKSAFKLSSASEACSYAQRESAMADFPRKLDIGAASPKRSYVGAGTPKQGEVKLEVPPSPVYPRKLSKPDIHSRNSHGQLSFWDSEPVWM